MSMRMNDPRQHRDQSISCYIGEIPSFIREALADAYETLHSSLPFFEICRSIEHANCYVAERAGHARTVLLFHCRGRQVDVLNEMLEIDQAEILRFAHYIFGYFKGVDVIGFRAVKTGHDQCALPVQRYASKETYVIALPATPKAYLESLGKSTRAGIRQGLNGLARHFPTFRAQFFVGHEIDERHVRAILALSENRINARDAHFSHDLERIIRLARQCGFVSVFTIDGRLCAGSVNYRIGASYFGEVTAHDPRYEKHGLGRLCMYLTVSESIARGGKKFYLGGGVFEFKQRMLGVPLAMEAMRLYRSPLAMVVNADVALMAAAAGAIDWCKGRLHQHRKAAWARYVFNAFYFFRNKLVK